MQKPRPRPEAVNCPESRPASLSITGVSPYSGPDRILRSRAKASKIPGVMDALVRLRGTTGAFRGSWTIRRGQQWAVRGPNGGGKTCLALLISGGVPPVGIDLALAEEVEENAGIVTFAQQESLASKSWLQARWHSGIDGPPETVREFLSYETVNGIHPFEVRDDDSAARRAFSALRSKTMDLLGLKPLLKRPVLALSNGEVRKLLLARALLGSPSCCWTKPASTWTKPRAASY